MTIHAWTDDFVARFWTRVDRRGPNDCWPWLGADNGKGRGRIVLRREGRHRVQVYAYAVAWQLVHGPIPPGQQINHNCPGGDNPNCVNPRHLFVGTQADNIHDAIRKGTQNSFGRQKLSAQDIRKIRELVQLGISRIDIAVHFKVTPQAIYNIVHGKTWGHLAIPS